MATAASYSALKIIQLLLDIRCIGKIYILLFTKDPHQLQNAGPAGLNQISKA